MAKKKSFSIERSLSQALTDTVIAAKNYTGELHVEVIPLRKIELDSGNPRDLTLSFRDLYEGISDDDKLYKQKSCEKDALRSMANSVKEQGIINPVTVYKDGEQYRLIAGERRTLASILAGKEDIPAKILTSKPNQLKFSLLQWIENIEREDLSLWERMRNLKKIFEAYAEKQQKTVGQITPTELSPLIGSSLQQAINYKNIMGASAKLHALIQNNQIKNIEKAALIAKAPVKTQDILIEACLKGVTLKELKKIVNDKKSIKHNIEKEKRGRQATRVNFGTTKDMNVAKAIIQSVLRDENFSRFTRELGEIVWEDYKSLTEAFKTLVKMLEHAE